MTFFSIFSTAFFSTLVPGARLGRWYWRLCSSICLWQLGHSLVKDLGDVRGDFTSVQVKRLRRLGVELLKGQGQLLGRSSHLHNSYWLICDIEPYRSPGPSNFDVYSKLFNLMCPVFLTISKVRFGSRCEAAWKLFTATNRFAPLCTATTDHFSYRPPLAPTWEGRSPLLLQGINHRLLLIPGITNKHRGRSVISKFLLGLCLLFHPLIWNQMTFDSLNEQILYIYMGSIILGESFAQSGNLVVKDTLLMIKRFQVIKLFPFLSKQ